MYLRLINLRLTDLRLTDLRLTDLQTYDLQTYDLSTYALTTYDSRHLPDCYTNVLLLKTINFGKTSQTAVSLYS